MGKLIFNAADVRRVVEHSLAAPEQRSIAYTKNPVTAPAVILVHDQGVYLMSNGEPGDLLDPADEGKAFAPHYVAYAKGCNPKLDEEWWDNGRDLVGGDDFAETLEWAKEIKALLDNGCDQLIITLSANRITLAGKRTRKAVA